MLPNDRSPLTKKGIAVDGHPGSQAAGRALGLEIESWRLRLDGDVDAPELGMEALGSGRTTLAWSGALNPAR